MNRSVIFQLLLVALVDLILVQACTKRPTPPKGGGNIDRPGGACVGNPYCVSTLMKDPCNGATCAKYPYAECRPDCDACEALFYVNNYRVNCEDLGASACLLDKRIGDCLGNFDRYYYDMESRSCDIFTYGGCDGNRNQFMMFEQCENACTCFLQKDEGEDCDAITARYYFNPETNMCEQFVYFGCGGNGNNFESMSECLTLCKPSD